MATTIKAVALNMRCYSLALAGMLICSACQILDPTVRRYENLLNKQPMIIAPYSPEHAARNGPGFVIIMRGDEAGKMGVPNGAEFRATLEKQLSEERLRGNNYCPRGYEIVQTNYFKHWYTEIGANCRE